MKKQGFSLIEMLTVIVVLALLMGLVVKLFPNIARSSEKATTVKKLQAVAFAINEYYAEYGTYPPVEGVTYSMEDVEATENEYPDSMAYYTGESASPPERKFGLCAYLTTCPMPGASFDAKTPGEDWFADGAADTSAKAKWAPFLEGIITGGGGEAGEEVGGVAQTYITKSKTIKDGWNRTIGYRSLPPYTSYDLWSAGRDGTTGTDDDILVDVME